MPSHPLHSLRPSRWRGALIALVSGVGLALPVGCASRGPGLQLHDAERFAALMARPDLPDAATLQAHYLDPGSAGVRLFTPGRIESADNLARAVAADPEAYRKGARLCLQAARDASAEASWVMAAVARVLDQPADSAAPAFALFGARNSGGTATADGLALGLEVLCQRVDTREAARAVVLDFVAHEITHVYQQRAFTGAVNFNLLFAALMEGMADHVMELARGQLSTAAAERHAYGVAHEAALWRAFQADVDSGAGFGHWLYTQKRGPDGAPPDMAYWLGKRVVEAYLARATDRREAIRTLLALRDPQQILRDSGYAERFR